MPDWLGKTVGKVRIEKLVAHGGMAEVYSGTHLTLERPVAVKVLHSHIEAEPILLERFDREAKVVASLRHRNIVQIFDFDAINGHPYIVMEYLKGPTLAAYLRHLHQRKKRIPSEQVARLLNEVAAALDYAHGKGVVHRDIKPGNIMLHNKTDEIPMNQPLTNDVEAIVTDFGLVRLLNRSTQTAASFISGTPAYMSPEQARGNQIDHRTDLYSLGIVLYEMLAGRVPFEADSTMAILQMQVSTPPPAIPGIPARVQAVIDRALLKNPNERYQNGQEMASDFSRSIGMAGRVEPIREIQSHTIMPTAARAAAPAVAPQQPGLAEPETPRKPTRAQAWIGIGFSSLVFLLLVALGAVLLLPKLLQPRAASGPPAASSVTGPLASETPELPAPEGMVAVAAGTYELGLPTADEYHIATVNMNLSGFWIDRYQTTNAQYRDFMTQTGAAPPEVWPWPDQADHPVRGIPWDQAVAYCAWAKKRLPREAEWEAAGRGPGAQPPVYPWGNDAAAGGLTLNLPDQDTYAVGTYPFNQSILGVFDMVGNIWEWVGEPYIDAPAEYRFLRGGRYGLPVNDLAYRLPVAPGDTRYTRYAGFRCAADRVR